jgi:hypothetical protein
VSICIAYSSKSQTINATSIATEWIDILNKHGTIALPALYSDSTKLGPPTGKGSKQGMKQ